MKKALLFALAGLLAVAAPALAYPPAANVNFSSERGVPFGLVLDGRPLTRGAARQVHVDQLAPGAHWADFTLPAPYGGAVRFRSRVWLEPGLETSFVLVARPGWPLALRQVDAMPLCAPGYGNGGYPGGHYNSPTYGHGQGGYGQGNPYGNGYGGRGTDGHASGNGGYNGGNSGYPNDNGGYSPGNGPTNGYDPNGAYDPAPSGAGYYPGAAVSSYRTLPPHDVDALVQAVQQHPFEASKLSTAKEALSQSSIQADDLKRLLRSLDSEASRVELAKFAYPHVADRQNFYRVYEVFDFDTSAQEVQQAVTAAPQN